MADAKKTLVMDWRHHESPYETHVWAVLQKHWLPLFLKDGNRPDFMPKSFKNDNVTPTVATVNFNGSALHDAIAVGLLGDAQEAAGNRSSIDVMAPSPEPVVHTVQFTAIMDDSPAAQELARKMIARMQENKK